MKKLHMITLSLFVATTIGAIPNSMMQNNPFFASGKAKNTTPTSNSSDQKTAIQNMITTQLLPLINGLSATSTPEDGKKIKETFKEIARQVIQQLRTKYPQAFPENSGQREKFLEKLANRKNRKSQS